MLFDATGFRHIYLLTGFTDLRKGIPGLSALVKGSFGLDPTEEGSIFLFCGRRNDRIKALVYEPGGWLLCYKRLTDGSFQWPRNQMEAMQLTQDQYQLLMQGFSVKQTININGPKPVLY